MTDCIACSSPIIDAVRKSKRYCSPACKMAHHRAQQRCLANGRLPNEPELFLGHLRNFSAAYANKIDVIIVDPPYDRKSLPLYKDLAAFAVMTLKVGGWLLCLTGNGISYDVETLFRGAGLEYISHVIYHTGSAGGQCKKWTSTGARLWQQHYKLVLWYQKPAPLTAGGRRKHSGHRRAGTRDYIASSNRADINQDHAAPGGHKWQQSLQGFQEIVDVFTNAQDVICDPCCGSGTTLLACVSRGRNHVIGIDVDPEAISKARYRLGLSGAVG